MYGYIYLTTNLINGKGYISKHKSDRFYPNYKGSGKLIKAAFDKYGYENFYVELLCRCFSEDELNSEEVFLIDYFGAVAADDFYNLAKGGNGGWDFWDQSGPNNPNYGKHLSPEVKAKLSAAKKGRPRKPEDVARLRALNTGKKRTEATKAKMSATRRGVPKSEDHKRKISEFNKGRVCIHLGSLNKAVHPEELQHYLDLGWEKGRRR